MWWSRRAMAFCVGAAAVSTVLAGCGSGGAASGASTTLTVYNAQHEELVKPMVDAFTTQTGIRVNIRSGEDSELANQLIQEGAASPADVFLTENSPSMDLVDSKGDFARIDSATAAQVPPGFVPSSGDWVGFAARSTVLAYNSRQLTPEALPASITDLASPQWKGKIGIAPGGADFQAIVSAVVALKGPAEAEQWLAGLKTNAKIYQGNTAVLKAVNSGEIQTGVIYHYYWYKDRAQSGANSANTELKFFGNQDPGAFLSTSGAGVLKSGKHQAQAQQLVKFLTSTSGQQILANSTALEYPVANGVAPNPRLKPLSELTPPAVDPSRLNGPQVIQLMQQAGLL